MDTNPNTQPHITRETRLTARTTALRILLALVVAVAVPAAALAVVASPANLSVTVNRSGDPVPGTDVTYTITVHNAGPGDALDAQLDVVLASELQNPKWSTGASIASVRVPPAGGRELHPMINLPAGTSAVYVVTGTIDPAARGLLRQSAALQGNASADSSQPSVIEGADEVALEPRCDLSIRLSSGAANLVPGAPATYTIVVSNAGPSYAFDAAVSAQLPKALQNPVWKAIDAPATVKVPPAGSGEFNPRINLAPGGSAQYEVTGVLDKSAFGGLTNTATVAPASDTLDPDNSNNLAVDDRELHRQTDLAVTVSHPAPESAVETGFRYVVTATNNGPSVSTGARLVIRLSDNLRLVETSPTWIQCGQKQGPVECDLGRLDVGESVDLRLAVAVTKDEKEGIEAEEPVSCNATVTADEEDIETGNNKTFSTPDAIAEPQDTDLVILGVEHGADSASGARHRTALALVNPTQADAPVTLTFKSGTTVTTANTSLPARGSVEMKDVLVSLFGVDPAAATSGTMRVQSPQAVAVEARTDTLSAGPSVSGNSVVGATAGDSLPFGDTAVIPGARNDSGTYTLVDLVNTGSVPAKATVQLFSGNGGVVGGALTVTLKPGEWQESGDLFQYLGASDVTQGYLAIHNLTDRSLVKASAVLIDRANGSRTVVPSNRWQRAGLRWLVPAVNTAGGSGRAAAHTDVAIVNASEHAANITFTYATAGDPATKIYTLSPHGSVDWRSILVDLFGLEPAGATTGVIEIESNVEVFVAARLVTETPSGSHAQFLPAAVPFCGWLHGTRAVLPHLVNDVGLRGNDSTGSFTTLGALNSDTESAQIRVILHGERGEQLGEPLETAVAGRSWLALGDIFAATHAPKTTNAYATVEVTSEKGAIWAFASIVDNVTGSTTTVQPQLRLHASD